MWRGRGGLARTHHWMGKKHAPSKQFTPLEKLKLRHMLHLGSDFSTHQKLSDSKRLAFAGLRARSLTSRSTRQIDPSVDVHEKIVNLTEKAERLSNELFSSVASGV